MHGVRTLSYVRSTNADSPRSRENRVSSFKLFLNNWRLPSSKFSVSKSSSLM
jgi:hypothetical protein